MIFIQFILVILVFMAMIAVCTLIYKKTISVPFAKSLENNGIDLSQFDDKDIKKLEKNDLLLTIYKFYIIFDIVGLIVSVIIIWKIKILIYMLLTIILCLVLLVLFIRQRMILKKSDLDLRLNIGL